MGEIERHINEVGRTGLSTLLRDRLGLGVQAEGASRRVQERFRVPVGAAGGLPAHASALARRLEDLEREELAHLISISPAPDRQLGERGARPVELVLRVHWGMGAWSQVLDPTECLTVRESRALRLLGYEVSVQRWGEPLAPGIGREYDRYDLAERLGPNTAIARHIADVLEVCGVTDDDELEYRIAPVEPELSIDEWLTDYCDHDLVLELLEPTDPA